MFIKRKVFMLCVILLVVAGVSNANVIWNNGNGTQDYLDGQNWDTGAVPTSSDTVFIYDSAGTLGMPIVDKSTAYGGTMRIGVDGYEGSLTVKDGGRLEATNIQLGWDDRVGTLNIDGGTTIAYGHLAVSMGGADAYLNINGGELLVTQLICDWGYENGQSGFSFVNISGGELKVYSSALLYVGTRIDVTDTGKFQYQGDVKTWFETLKSDGLLFSSQGSVKIDYNETEAGWTTAQMIPEPATMVILGLGALLAKKKGSN